MSGKQFLDIRPLRANINGHGDQYNSMSPFLSFKHHDQKHNTQVAQFGNRTPQWNDTITLEVGDQDEILMHVWDHNTHQNGESIGFSKLHVNELCQANNTNQLDVPVKSFGEIIGNVTLSVRRRPEFQQTGFQQTGFQQTGFTVQHNTTKGTLEFKPLRCDITAPHGHLNNMHPYLVVNIKDEKKKTSTCSHGNRNPRWNEELVYDVDLADPVMIHVWDEATAANGESVGFVKCTVGDLARMGSEHQVDLHIKSFGEVIGTLTVATKLTPEGQALGGFGAGGFAQSGGFQPDPFAPQANSGFGQSGFQQGGFQQGGFQQGGFQQQQGGFQQGGFNQGGW